MDPIIYADVVMAKGAAVVESKVYGFSATYVKCEECFSVQVINPHWLVEAHSKAVSKLNTGMAAHCLSVICLISTALFLEGKRELLGLDWGGGNSLLCCLMRDLGFQIKTYDKYAENILSEGFL